MNFKDWFITKISPKQVTEMQSDSPTAVSLHRHFENHPSKGLTPARLYRILQEAEQGNLIAQSELFMDMEEKDAHIAAELSKRKMSVKKLDWSLQPPRDASELEKTNTKLLENLIRDEIDCGALRQDMLDAIGHGYACIELGWDRTADGKWYPNQLIHRPPTWFTCPLDHRNDIYLRDSGSMIGTPLQPWGWIAHQHKSRSGYIARTGLHRVLAWPYLLKNYSARDLAEFLEIYGMPIRIGKYPPGTDDKAKADLLRTVLSIGHNAAGIIPDTMMLELATVTGSGNADSFRVMIDWCEASQSKAILGGTLTSSTGANGNRSLGDVHNEVRLDIRDDDAVQVDQTLTMQLVYPMAMLNGLFNDNRCPRFVSDIQEPDDLALFADALPKLASVGAKIPVSYVNMKLKIPVPEDGEEILQPNTRVTDSVNANPNNPPKTSGAPGALSLPGQQDNAAQQADIDPTPVSAQTDLLAIAASKSVRFMVDAIRAKTDKAESLEALRDDLLDSYGDLDSGELSKIMTLAFATADLSGRFDVSEHG